jgi:putative FmdB family regulatory protein
MPTYVFKCQECDYELEVEQSIKKPTPNRKKCPECGKNKLERLLFAPHVYNKPGDDKITLGLLSDRNASRFSQDQKEALDKKNGVKRKKRKEKKQFWESSDKEMKQIANMTPQQKKKYIETGEK